MTEAPAPRARTSARRWGPWCGFALAMAVLAVRLPAAYREPALDLWTNMGVGWAWRTHPDLNVYDPPALRAVLYNSPTYGEFRVVSAWGLPFNSFISTPCLLALYTPLSFLSLDAARLLWFVVGVAVCALVTAWIVRQLWQRDRRWLAAGFAVYAACYAPMYMDWGHGNTNSVLLACALGAGLAIAKQRDLLAGGLLSVLAFFKLYPGLLFVYVLYKREWRLAGYAALVGGAFGLLGLWAVGWEAFTDYCTLILPTIGGGNTSGHNQGLTGLWLHFQFPDLIGRLEPPPVGRPLGLTVVSLILLAIAGWRARGPLERGDFAISAEYGLAWATMFLLAPSVWDHYFTLMLLPLGGRWIAVVDDPRPVSVAITALVSAGIGFTPDVGDGLLIHVRPICLLLLWALCVWQARAAPTRTA